MSKKKERNHFDEFCTYLEQQTVLSKEFRDNLIMKLSAAMADAFDRGYVKGSHAE